MLSRFDAMLDVRDEIVRLNSLPSSFKNRLDSAVLLGLLIGHLRCIVGREPTKADIDRIMQHHPILNES